MSLYGEATGAPQIGWGTGESQYFPNPFYDYASMIMPDSTTMAMQYCQHILSANGVYREALRRLMAYFSTRVSIDTDDPKVEQMWSQLLVHDLGIMQFLPAVGMDVGCYGNSFISVIEIKRRHLLCQNCRRVMQPLTKIARSPERRFKYHFRKVQFTAHCPMCKTYGQWQPVDLANQAGPAVRLKRWNPFHIDIRPRHYSSNKSYVWKIPEKFKRAIRNSVPEDLEDAPLEVLEAIANDDYLEFADGSIHHTMEQPLAGLDEGWGLSKVLHNFRQAFYVQVMHRFNEALVMDYIIPLRVLTPKNSGGAPASSSDFLKNNDGSMWLGAINGMLARRRRDPAAYFTLPYEVQYQMLGGDAKNLAPEGLLKDGRDTLLDCAGIPAEIFKANLTVQAAPTALRLMQSANAEIPQAYERVVQFIVSKIAPIVRWPVVKTSMEPVTIADDASKAMAKLQITQAGDITKQDGYKEFGIDYESQAKKKVREKIMEAEQAQKLQSRLDRSSAQQQLWQPPQPGDPNAQGGMPADPSAGGAAGAPAAPASPGTAAAASMPNPGASLMQIQQQAQYEAGRLISMPYEMRKSELMRLKTISPALHALTRQIMDEMQNRDKTVGGYQVTQARAQGAPPQ